MPMQFTEAPAKIRIRDPFYLVMTVVLMAIVVFGFSHTVPGDLQVPDFPVLLVVHGAIFGAWVLVALAQPALVMNGSLALHRRLGWVGVALAVAMVVLGASAVVLALWADSVPPFYPHGLFVIRGLIGLVVFAALVGAAVARRRQAGWHKRLMLCASIAVIVPGLERAMPLFLFGARWPFVVDGVVDALLLAGPIVDWVVRRRIHPAWLWGGGVIVGGQVLVYALAPSPVAQAMLHALHVS